MNNLFKLISTFSDEEQKEAVQFLKKKNRRGDAKNILLFKMICQGKTKELPQTLYKKMNRNAYHALSKRLRDSLLEFIASKSFAKESSEESDTLKLLLSSRILFEKKLFKLGWKTLSKAEELAFEFELHTALHEIYDTQLQYAAILPEINLNSILDNSDRNLRMLNTTLKFKQAYATLKRKLRAGTTNKNIALKEVLDYFNIIPNQDFTYKSLFQFMDLLCDTAEAESNYYDISPLMQEAFRHVNTKKTSNKHSYYHLQILYLMASNSFRNKNFQKTLDFLDELDSILSKRYLYQFRNQTLILRSLTLNYSGNPLAAIELCENIKSNEPQVQLLLTTLYFHQNRYKDAYQIYKKFQHSDHYYERHQGLTWVVKKEIIGFLLLIELDKLDLVLQKQKSLHKRFYNRLKALGEERVLTFIKLASIYYKNPKHVQSDTFTKEVDRSFEWVGLEREDLFAISFYAWLKSKMINQNLYKVTLDLINPTNHSL